MYKAFIEPDLKTAHLRIYNTFNPFSGFMNATYILKSARRVSPDVIKSVLKACPSLPFHLQSEAAVVALYAIHTLLLLLGTAPAKPHLPSKKRHNSLALTLQNTHWASPHQCVIKC